MASYTDAITQFKPYVQQLPVELMMKVGAYKQQQYDQGVQKIQSYIDNIAGLDIYRPVDKQHLESKMNELGSKLRTVAGGDFSNQQLVSSVGGMTSSIVKDPILQAAVSSTAKIKAGQAKRKELEKKGLTDANNDKLYADTVNKYASNTELTDEDGNPIEFNGDYVPYTNIMKIVGEGLTNAGEKKEIAENILIMENGKPKMFYKDVKNPKTGKIEKVPDGFKYADVKTIDSLTSNREAVLAVLDNTFKRGDVKRQLQIDGWATYSDIPVEPLVGKLVQQHEEFDSIYENKMLELTALSEATNLSKEQKEQYQKQISDLAQSKSENEKQFAETYQAAFKNPEAFKQNLYEVEFRGNLMKQFLKEDVQTKVESNPGRLQQNWYEDKLFNIQKENRRIAEANRDYGLRAYASAREDKVFQAKYYIDPATGEYRERPTPDKAQKVIDPKTLFSGSNPGEKLPDDHAISRIHQDINILSSAKKDIAFKLFAEYMRKVNKNPGMTDKQIDETVSAWSKNSRETPEQYLFRWANNMQNKYIENGLTPPQDLNRKLNAFHTASDELDNVNYINNKSQEAAMKALNVIFPKVKLRNGESVNVDLEDQTSYLLAHGPQSNDTFRNLPKTNIGQAHQRLVSKYGPNYHAILSPLLGHTGQNVKTNRQEYTKVWNSELAKYIGVSDSTGGSLPMSKTEEINESVGLVSAYLDSAQGMRKLGSETELAALKKALSNPTSITWKANKPTNHLEDWSGSITVTDKEGGVHEIENISKEDLSKLTNLKFADYQSTPIQNLITLNTNTNSTNRNGFVEDADAWKGAYFKENKLLNPTAQKSDYKFRADALGVPGGYQMVYYIKPPTSNKFQLIYGNIYKDEATLEQTYRSVTGDAIKNQYLQYLQSLKK